MKLLRNLAVLLLLTATFSGCLRYTPSRAEIESENPGTENFVRSEEEFFSVEKTQREQLNVLIQERRTDLTQASDVSYRIGVGDLLQITVFDVPELNLQVRVRPGGSIALPLVGELVAVGKTEAELQSDLSKKLDAYLQRPQVTILISEYAANRVSVMGEVSRPGLIALKRDDYTLLEAISEAGGRTQRAGGYVVFIPAKSKAVDPNAKAALSASPGFGIEIPFDEIMGSKDQAPINLTLKAGDTIIIPEAGKVQVDGEVNRPGSFELAARMTLLGAIASAGSITYSADANNIEVIREFSPGKKAIITADLEKIALGGGKDVRLRDGDVVRVPSASSRFATRQVVNAITSVINFGVGGTVSMGP